MNSAAILQLLGLISAAEPAVLGYIKSLLESAQGKTGDQFLAEADSIWAQVRAKAAAEIANATPPAAPAVKK
jgi:hypothetical protein